MKDLRLWYEQEATCFEEALPIGNGRMGGMVYGGIFEETVTLNEDTLWSGRTDQSIPANAMGAIDEIRRLLQEGDRHSAGDVVWQRLMGEPTACYEPAGALHVSLPHAGEATDYQRDLDLETGVATVSYRVGNVQYRREVFCSFADQVMVIRLSASEPVLCGSVHFTTPHATCEVQTDCHAVYAVSKTPYYTDIGGYKGEKGAFYDEEKSSIRFCMGVRAVADGAVTAQADALCFADCREVCLLVDIVSDYEHYDKVPNGTPEKLVACCRERLADKTDYTTLKQRHIADHTALFNRVSFHVDGPRRADLPTDKRIEAYQTTRDDVGLYEQLYQYGRYLLMASSRPGSQPANLQGIWNEEVVAPWSSGYTVNINLEMNYWHAESTRLSECHEPLLRFVRELAEKGKEQAAVYGCRGWCSHHNNDLWRYVGMVNRHWKASMPSVGYACWPMGGAWLTTHLWQHYVYTGDLDFLRECYTVIQGCAQFLLDFLIENKEGYLVTSFGSSPENSYWYEEKKQAISQGCTMDMAIIRDVWNAYLQASRLLGKHDALCDEIVTALPKLLPYRIGERGQLMEWEEEFPPCQIQHRHLSPLYGFYPGNSITRARDPELTQAVETLLAERGDANSGWSMGWKVNMHARLGHGDRALDLIKLLLRPVPPKDNTKGGGVYINLLDVHPPFQIDGNFGVTAGITEMLLQSHEDFVELLPALPVAWMQGEVKGLLARGGYITDMVWKNGTLSFAKLTAAQKGELRLRVQPHWQIKHNGHAVAVNGAVVSVAVEGNDEVEVFG
ncbi:MAG: glycoside hydrolase family 95 protein [Clostridia bacterium]|nr:glycoside hydrolase family 95 protein [Clostridia bacterium]